MNNWQVKTEAGGSGDKWWQHWLVTYGEYAFTAKSEEQAQWLADTLNSYDAIQEMGLDE